jgi:isocitrate lyase
MYRLALGYKVRGMSAYSELQQAEFASEKEGYTATRHQHEVGTGYFDLVTEIATAGEGETRALVDSTEAHQFQARSA